MLGGDYGFFGNDPVRCEFRSSTQQRQGVERGFACSIQFDA